MVLEIATGYGYSLTFGWNMLINWLACWASPFCLLISESQNLKQIRDFKELTQHLSLTSFHRCFHLCLGQWFQCLRTVHHPWHRPLAHQLSSAKVSLQLLFLHLTYHRTCSSCGVKCSTAPMISVMETTWAITLPFTELWHTYQVQSDWLWLGLHRCLVCQLEFSTST